MKFTLPLLLVLSFIFTVPCYSQNGTDRWEIGIDALSLFTKNNIPNYSIFARYKLNPDAEKKSFLRTRLGYLFEAYKINSPNKDIIFQDIKETGSMISLGYQRDFLNFSNTSLYYGGDLIYINSTNDEFTLISTEEIEYSGHTIIKTKSLNFNGFVGIGFRPTKSIKISCESGLYAGRRQMKLDYVAKNTIGDVMGFGNEFSDRFIYGIQPFYQILITLTL